jgi:chromosome segregation ATPase
VEVSGQVTAAESQLVDAQVEMAQLRADQAVAMKLVDQKNRETAQLLGQVMQVRKQNARLQGQIATYQQHVRDLRKSRWRRFGLRIGIARKAAWETLSQSPEGSDAG